MTLRKNKRVTISAVIIFAILISICAFYLFRSVRSNFSSLIETEIPAFDNIAQLIDKNEYAVDGMVGFITESFTAGNFSFNAASISKYLENLDPYIESVVINNSTIQGAWFHFNPDIFMSIKDKNIVLQDFKFGSWYLRQKNESIIKGPKSNEIMTRDADPYYFEAIDKGRMIITKPYLDPIINIEMITLSAPVYASGRLLGVAGVDFEKKIFDSYLAFNKTGKEACSVYIFNEDGELTVTSNEISRETLNFVTNNLQYASKYHEYRKIKNDRLVLYENSNLRGPFIIGEIRLSKIIKSQNFLIHLLYFSFLIFTVIIILLLIRLSKNNEIEDNENEQEVLNFSINKGDLK